MATLRCHLPVKLSVHSREVEAISWSEDQRIAITSSQDVYVLTLKGSSCSPSFSLPASISVAAAPPYRENPSPDTPVAAAYDPSRDKLDFSHYLDPMIIPNHTPMGYRESRWSPAGCDVMGGCLLSVLTIGGQLWLLTPPGSQAMKWQISTSLNSGAKFAACTTFHWLPWTIPTECGRGGIAVVAVATRSRHIGLLAMEVPVYRQRAPKLDVLWEGEIGSGGEWPCRLRWSHTPSPNAMAHLAVGMTSGQLMILSWCLPAVWREDEPLPQPHKRTLWDQGDGMAVRHIAWQHALSPSEQLWLVFSKVSTLVAMQLKNTPTPPPYITIYGVHSRTVSGIASLPSNQFVSCALDSSIQTLQLNQSCDSHVIPTPVAMETVSGECTANGVVVSEDGLYLAVLTSMCSAASSKQQLCSHLHCSPLLPLSQLDLHTVNFSWDISEAIRMHTVAKQPLPGNVQEMLTSQQSSQQQLSHMLQLCVHTHTRQLVMHNEGDGAGGDGVLGGDGDSGVDDSDDLCAVVLMEHVCKVLGECVQQVRGDDARMSLYVMSQWVESSRLATPTQQLMAKMTLSGLKREAAARAETCPICSVSIPFTNYRRETCANGHSWERCCMTLLLATSSHCGCCRGCRATAHNVVSLQPTPGSWFERLLSKGRCTYCQSYFDLVT